MASPHDSSAAANQRPAVRADASLAQRLSAGLRTLRLQLRFLLPLLVTLIVAAYLAVPLMDQLTLRWFARDMNSRGMLVANALSDSVTEALAAGQPARLQKMLERTLQDERLYAVGLCSADGELLQATANFPRSLGCLAALQRCGSWELLGAGDDLRGGAAGRRPSGMTGLTPRP